ncbi:MAG: hypothetical protein IPF92_31015 [Myxococcales bacterium]|nr:hypothetical protein [Myxococcales bacterium]
MVDGRAEVVNAFPRCVSREGNLRALAPRVGSSRPATASGAASRGCLEATFGCGRSSRPTTRRCASRRPRASLVAPRGRDAPSECRCGGIMTGRLQPTDCRLFGRACRPDAPVGACMVSTEGVCRIWYEHGALARGQRRVRSVP